MDPTPPPTPPEGPSQDSSQDSSEGPPTSSPPASVEWRLASPDGSQQFGPTVPAVFAQWIAEGRVQPDWLVWRSDWSEWKRAADAADDLPVPLLPKTAPPQASTEPATTSATAPVSPPPPTSASYTARRRRSQRQQRTLVVVLGIVTLGLLGLLAWLVVG